MVRLLVISDSHGDSRALMRALDEQPEARYILHLGDGASEMRALAPTCTAHVYQVRGNCDLSAPFPVEQNLRIAGIPLFMTHGHRYGVKGGLGTLADEARRRGAQIVLFGHTHVSLTRYEDGLYLINPGSLGYSGTYATVDIVGGDIAPNIIRIR